MQENMEIAPQWLTYRQAQELTGLSRTTLWNHAVEGRIVLSKQGRAVRLFRPSLDDLMWQGVWRAEPESAFDSNGHVVEYQHEGATPNSNRKEQ